MNIKNIILGLIIAFVFLFFCVYGTKLIYHEPDYNRYCNMPPAIPDITQEFCEQTNGTWITQELRCITTPCPQGYCDYYSKCQMGFDDVSERYAKNLFGITLFVSIIIIAVSAFLIPVESVAGGLMFGSLMYLIYGTGSYWRFMNDYFRFAILGVALIVLIYIGYKLATRENKKKKRR